MESDGAYDLIILSLPVITSYSMITGISHDEDRLWVIIGNQLIDGGLLYETLYIHEYFLLYFLPLEFDIFLGESREE
jgi:hypothetical protein